MVGFENEAMATLLCDGGRSCGMTGGSGYGDGVLEIVIVAYTISCQFTVGQNYRVFGVQSSVSREKKNVLIEYPHPVYVQYFVILVLGSPKYEMPAL